MRDGKINYGKREGCVEGSKMEVITNNSLINSFLQ